MSDLLCSGINGNLVSLSSKEGMDLLEKSRDQNCSKHEKIHKYFGKQDHNTFCGVKSACIVLNSILDSDVHKEDSLLSEVSGDIIEEADVRRRGMTLTQCRDIINSVSEVKAECFNTDEVTLDIFRNIVHESCSGVSTNKYVREDIFCDKSKSIDIVV